MMRRSHWVISLSGVVVLAVILGAWAALGHLSLSALNEPSRAEVQVATMFKHYLVRRSSHSPLPHPTPDDAASVANGRMQFGAHCSVCHGRDGRTPTDVGRWMYPRAPDLGSAAVQRWTDAELSWIIKNGLRPTGMPGFAHLHSDEEIWDFVHYVRSLGRAMP